MDTNPNQQPSPSQQQTEQIPAPLSSSDPSKAFIILIVILLAMVVSIGGYVLGTKQNKIVENQTQPATPTPQLSSTPADEIADWKTYRNEEFGFELRYPSMYDGKENCRPRVVDSGKENALAFVGPITFSMDDAKELALSKYVGRIVQQIEENTQRYSVSKVKSKSNITFSGRGAIKLVSQFCGAGCSEPQNIYIEKRGEILKINYDDGIINQCPFNSYNLPSEVADQILPTFKFLSLEQTRDTSNWKTYKNTKYGFEFKYPSDHTVYSDVDQKKPALIPATSTSDIARVASLEAHVFCCEPTTLSFSIKSTTRKAREWAEEYLNIIPEWKDELPVVKDTTFVGKPAVEANGRGGYGPPYRLVVIPLSSSLLVIIQNMNDPLLSEILSSFRFD